MRRLPTVAGRGDGFGRSASGTRKSAPRPARLLSKQFFCRGHAGNIPRFRPRGRRRGDVVPSLPTPPPTAARGDRATVEHGFFSLPVVEQTLLHTTRGLPPAAGRQQRITGAVPGHRLPRPDRGAADECRPVSSAPAGTLGSGAQAAVSRDSKFTSVNASTGLRNSSPVDRPSGAAARRVVQPGGRSPLSAAGAGFRRGAISRTTDLTTPSRFLL